MWFLGPGILYVVAWALVVMLASQRRWSMALPLALLLAAALVPPAIAALAWEPRPADEPISRRTAVGIVAAISMLVADGVTLGVLVVWLVRQARGPNP